MLRLRAVKTLLVEEVAGVAPRSSKAPEEEGGADPAEVAAEEGERQTADLERAMRKALRVVILCTVAVIVLFLTHERSGGFLSLDGLDTIFTAGVLLVVAYAGFRLGQWEKYRAVARVLAELGEREER